MKYQKYFKGAEDSKKFLIQFLKEDKKQIKFTSIWVLETIKEYEKEIIETKKIVDSKKIEVWKNVPANFATQKKAYHKKNIKEIIFIKGKSIEDSKPIINRKKNIEDIILPTLKIIKENVLEYEYLSNSHDELSKEEKQFFRGLGNNEKNKLKNFLSTKNLTITDISDLDYLNFFINNLQNELNSIEASKISVKLVNYFEKNDKKESIADNDENNTLKEILSILIGVIKPNIELIKTKKLEKNVKSIENSSNKVNLGKYELQNIMKSFLKEFKHELGLMEGISITRLQKEKIKEILINKYPDKRFNFDSVFAHLRSKYYFAKPNRNNQ